MPTPTLIIGFGSGIRGDDSLGPRAADILAARLAGDPTVTVLSRPSLTPELAPTVAESSLVIFIDCAADGPIGQVIRQPVTPASDSTVSMVHFLDPAGLLYWAKRLYGHAPRAVALSVAGESFAISDNLTPSAAAALTELVDTALTLVPPRPPATIRP